MNSVNFVSGYYQGMLFTLNHVIFVVLQTGCSLADGFLNLESVQIKSVNFNAIVLCVNVNVAKYRELELICLFISRVLCG